MRARVLVSNAGNRLHPVGVETRQVRIQSARSAGEGRSQGAALQLRRRQTRDGLAPGWYLLTDPTPIPLVCVSQ